MARKKICAVVPAYKEEKRISIILKNLEKSIVDEIIVVDDGSKDNTESVVKKFKKVRYLKNIKNIGKGYSMDRGVKNTNAEIIFFCDADVNLSTESINKIIQPVIDGYFEMSLGLRYSVNLLLLTGQRALKRELWERVPDFYKDKFRIELGMNFYCKSYCSAVFNYSQAIKEDKYGVVWGLYRRFFMVRDIIYAVVRYYLLN